MFPRPDDVNEGWCKSKERKSGYYCKTKPVSKTKMKKKSKEKIINSNEFLKRVHSNEFIIHIYYFFISIY